MSTKPTFFFSRNNKFSAFPNSAPFGFKEDGAYWPTVEHYFQAQKFPGLEMADYRTRIRNASSPKNAKALGRAEKFPLRPDWEQVKEDVMRHA